MPARSVSTVEKRSFFWYVRFVGSYSTKFSLPEFSSFSNFFQSLKKFPAFPKFGNFGQFKLKQSQLSSPFPSCKYLPEFSSFRKFRYGPLQLLSNSQLQSQLKTTAKIWKSSKILVWRTIILLKNTTARERNQNQGERKNLEKLTEFDKWEKLEEKEIFGRIG